MSSEWAVVKLGTLADFQEGYVNPSQRDTSYFDGPIKWLRATDLNDSVVTNTTRTLSDKGFKSAGKSAQLFEPGTLAISKSGTIGRLGMLGDYMCGNRAVINIKPKQNAVPRYLFFVLRHLRPTIETLAEGSVQKNLYVSTLSNLDVPAPPRDVQQSFADTLGALDDRITLLRETNATLEAIAQALFKSWFVDFDPVRAKMEGCTPEGIHESTAALFPDGFETSELGEVPKGWQPIRLDSFLELAYGKALKAENRKPGLVPVYGSGGVTGWHDTPLIDGPSIIVGRKGTVGSLYWESRPFYPIDTVFYVKAKRPLTYCHQLLKTLGLDGMNTDAAVPGLNRENVYRLLVPDVPAEMLAAFDTSASALRDSIDHNEAQAQTLSALRDTLLPRLISGQLRLPEAQAATEAALGGAL